MSLSGRQWWVVVGLGFALLEQGSLAQFTVMSAPSPSPAAPTAASQDEQVIQEVQNLNQPLEQVVSPINNMNPMSDRPLMDLSPEALAANPQLAKLKAIMEHPATKTYLKIFSDTEVIEGVKKLSEHPDLKTLGMVQLAFILFMMVFRAWRHAKATHWGRRMWISLYCFVISTCMTAWLIPAYILGSSYTDTMKRLYTLIREVA